MRFRLLVFVCGASFAASSVAVELRVGSFTINATPPVGSPLCFALAPPSTGTSDPLSARGIVFQAADEKPIVLVAVDWVGIGNTGHEEWRTAIAKACGTTVDHVAVHTLHQHDAPGCDFLAEEVAAAAGLGGELFDVAFARDVIARSADAARGALAAAEPATHMGVGAGRVEQVASNRRILGADGKVEFQRMSSCTNPAMREMPEGTIDPLARVVSFWRDEKLLAALTYYTTHPQSYYRTGRTSADFVGLARDAREAALGGALHVHFNGAGGNIAAGKYNDGSHEMRPVLAERLAAGLETAWNASEKSLLAAAEFEWMTQDVALPPNERLDREQLENVLYDAAAPKVDRLQAARSLAFLQRFDEGHEITLARLRIGQVDLLHVPGELFVEYQLAAQRLAPQRFVCTAAYGDYGPGYIGLSESYAQGGYETDIGSRVSPRAESVLMRAITHLLK